MKEEISLDIAMSKEEMAKIKELLTSSPGLRHYAFELKTGEYLDLVEYKDYEKLEQENKSLQSQLKEKEEVIKEAREYIKEHIRIDDEYPAYMEMLITERDELDEILSKGENK